LFAGRIFIDIFPVNLSGLDFLVYSFVSVFLSMEFQAFHGVVFRGSFYEGGGGDFISRKS